MQVMYTASKEHTFVSYNWWRNNRKYFDLKGKIVMTHFPARACISYLPTHAGLFSVIGKWKCDKLGIDSQLVK